MAKRAGRLTSDQPVEGLNQLTAIDVLTMGLVSHGANQEDFFLRKSEEASMPDEALQLENDTPEPGWMSRLVARLTRVEQQVAKSSMTPQSRKTLGKALGLLKECGEEVPPEVKKLMDALSPMADEETEEDEEAPMSEGEEPKLAATPAPPATEEGPAPALDMEPESKSEPKPEDDLPFAEAKKEEDPIMPDELAKSIPGEVAERLAVLEKSNSDLMAELQKARDAEFKSVYLAKAGELAALPIPSAELADHLMFVAKHDTERAERLIVALKAVDAQLRDAGIFGENGTAQLSASEQAALGDISKAADPRDALLKLPTDRAEAYLDERRHSIRSGR